VGRRRPRVAIVGLGLVGGSLARALTAAGYLVTGIDWPLVVKQALRKRAIAAGATRAEAAAAADVVVLAAPPATNLRLLRRLRAVARPDLVITDVSSVKGEIAHEAARLGFSGFVGGHPMAGTEKRGDDARHPRPRHGVPEPRPAGRRLGAAGSCPCRPGRASPAQAGGAGIQGHDPSRPQPAPALEGHPPVEPARGPPGAGGARALPRQGGPVRLSGRGLLGRGPAAVRSGQRP
jgi:hypothetical protein